MELEDRSGWEVGQTQTIEGQPCLLVRLETVVRRGDVAMVWHATRADGSPLSTVQFVPRS